MGETTKIQWCDHTFNGWIGCAKISDGCKFCYASVDTPARVAKGKGIELWGPDAARQITSDTNWRKPLTWNRAAAEAGVRRRVFTASQSDVFEDRPDLVEPRDRLFGLIAATKRLDWLVLTKRPEIAKTYFGRSFMWGAAAAYRDLVHGPDSDVSLGDGLSDWPPRNVWLGTSVEDRKHGLPRIDVLRNVPAAVRFLSVEPLLEDLGTLDLTGIHWIICGGESGPNARPFDLKWARSIRDQCEAAGVAYFFKQAGSQPFDSFYRSGVSDQRLHLHDKKGGDLSELPVDLHVREFPS